MDWFERLTGFSEETPEQVRKNLILEGNTIISKINGKKYRCGQLQIASLETLRREVAKIDGFKRGQITVREVVGDVQLFHLGPDNENALFQAASQFNLLEMVSPSVSPESGIGRYEFDKTQGPACAIACGAGTIYRNYFVPVNGQIGQTEAQQIDCLDLLAAYFDNANKLLWRNRNGYALCNEPGLEHISSVLKGLDASQYEFVKGKLKVGIQWNTQVTIAPRPLHVSQIYCSALPVGYSDVPAQKWEVFARLILEATYEATVIAGMLNRAGFGSNKVFLTLVGGGVFGNEANWLVDSISRVLHKYLDCGLDIAFVSYGGASATVAEIMSRINR